ncbi:VOC family protein [Vallicoccus soli]|uniref:Glyoxalase-like domain-containing protein n=1 Tax=Vallicoccus soli TaxID=2339232 RepID=A0A3A3YUC9_9ACTN|nr:VOC family protein [Vallicoccus soli]RJK93402.1 hypothetical protein D5H78_16360 [Vallicoccus soli]
MALARWKDLCIDVADPARAAAFWALALGLRAEPRGDDLTKLAGDPPERVVWLNRVPEPKTGKSRAHLDLVLAAAEVDALLAAGGARVAEHGERGLRWDVLADPGGVELCAFAPVQDAAPAVPTALVVDSLDPVADAAWWAGVLGAQVVEGPDGRPRWLSAVPGLPWDVWKFVPVDDARTGKNRVHWDVWCDDLDALLERGARVLPGYPGDEHWRVLADPAGNEFCAAVPR